MSNFESQLLSRVEIPLSGSPKKLPAADTSISPGITAVYIMAEEAFDLVYGPEERALIASRVNASSQLIRPQDYRNSSKIWPDVELIFSGWGMVPTDDAFFQRFPSLKMLFYAAGTVRGFVTESLWLHRVRLTNAASANAVPVSEYTLSQILFSLKHGWQQALYIRQRHHFPPALQAPGGYRSTVGLISLGMIGRLVAERLQHFELHVIAHDPLFRPDEAEKLGVKLVTLEEIFAEADVVSCHAPLLKETEKMIGRRHFESMKPGSTFINTARGAVVNEEEMIAVLQKRPDLFALLDVTHPMPPIEGSPLYTLENVMLTPHIAGSLGMECRRMGRLMVDEMERYLSGKPLLHEIDRNCLHAMA